MALLAEGLNDCETARATDVPRGTVRDWRNGCTRERRVDAELRCPRCGHPRHDFNELPKASYAYLLGMYLGDGDISAYPRTCRLRITMDLNWPDVMFECARAMEAVFPKNQVSLCRPDPTSGCAVVSVYSKQLVCLFPQHGGGRKHCRRIELADWHRQIVAYERQLFLRGLIHSDGCRSMNTIRSSGRTYSYPRYTFSNRSADIRDLFTSTCDQLGIKWRRMNAYNISVARRQSVARLDEFVGPKS